jgi:hypothetical protein
MDDYDVYIDTNAMVGKHLVPEFTVENPRRAVEEFFLALTDKILDHTKWVMESTNPIHSTRHAYKARAFALQLDDAMRCLSNAQG